EAIRPAILYSDTRAADEAAWINQTTGSAALRRITGNDQDASSLLAKFLWLQKHESFTDIDAILTGAHDYVVLKLCGLACTDAVTPSTTGLMDLSMRIWSGELLGALGLGGLPLAALMPTNSIVGKISAQAAGLTGLPVGLPVCHAPGDAGTTTLGAGAGERGT